MRILQTLIIGAVSAGSVTIEMSVPILKSGPYKWILSEQLSSHKNKSHNPLTLGPFMRCQPVKLKLILKLLQCLGLFCVRNLKS